MFDLSHYDESEAEPQAKRDGMTAIYIPEVLREQLTSMLPQRVTASQFIYLIIERLEQLTPEEVEGLLHEDGIAALRPLSLLKIKLDSSTLNAFMERCDRFQVHHSDVARGIFLNFGKLTRLRIMELAKDGIAKKTVRAA